MKINEKINAQFSLEFIVLLTFMFIVFLGFTAVITTKILDAKEKEREKIAEDIATLAKNEIDLARSVSDGYYRTFTLPVRVGGNIYSIAIISDRELVVNYVDKEYIFFLPGNVRGNIGVGLNEISKIEGIVYLNSIQSTTECNDGIDNDGDFAIDLNDAGCPDPFDNDETNCGDNICEGGEAWPFCLADCSAPEVLLMKNILGNAISFRADGNVILKGTLDTLNPSPSSTLDDEVIISDGAGNAVAIVNLITGNMVIRGNLFESQSTLTPSPASDDFIVKNFLDDIVSYIDESGNFYLKGNLTENGIP